MALTFIDLEKAYDNVDRSMMWEDLNKMIPNTHLIWDLQRMYENLRATIIGGEGTRIPLNKGVKQGCPCSPILFGLFFEQMEEWVQQRVEKHLESSRRAKQDYV